MMDLASFEDDLDRHGSDLSTWPLTSRVEADQLLAATPQARAALTAMRQVEAVLRAGRPVASDADRVAARASRHRQARPLPPAVRRAGWAAAAAIALFLGLYVGGATSLHDDGGEAVIAAGFDTMGPVDVE